MINKLNSPCKDCTDRAVGCHGKCEKYQAYRLEVDKLRMARAELDFAHDPLNGYFRTRKAHRLHAESRRTK